MRVVHIITDLDVGGAETMLARLLETLDGGPVKSTVISLSTAGPVADRLRRAGVPVFSLRMRSGRASPVACWRLIRLLRQLRPDLVQTWLYHADLAGLVAGTLAGVPRIVWNIRCAALDPRDHPRSLAPLLRVLAFASRWPALVIFNSADGRRAHEQVGFAPRRCLVIPNGFDTDEFCPSQAARAALRAELGLPDDTPAVGLLARYHPMKDHATFLSAARVVLAARGDVHFVAAGRGVAANPVLTHMIHQLDLRDRVHLLDERSDAPQFLAGLDVVVSSSYGEAFPNVIGEAMACGTPCVATDVGDSAYLVGATGAMVPPRDPAALGAAVLRMLALNPASRKALGRVARDRIVAEFGLERIAARYAEVYLDLAGRPMGAPNESTCAG